MNREIKLHDGEEIASMCPLVGRPNAFLVITTWGHMWIVTLIDGPGGHSVDRWTARCVDSQADKDRGTGDAGL